MITAAEINHEISVLTLRGEISSSLEKQLQDIISKSIAGTIILDFYHVDLFDDSSLNALVRLHNASRGSGKRLLAARLVGQLADIFKMTRLDEGIPVFNTVREAAAYAGFSPVLPVEFEDGIQEVGQRSPLKTGYAWPGPFTRLSVRGMPAQAINLNVDGRRVAGPLQGFGQLWQKTYKAVLDDIKLSPGELIEVRGASYLAK
jgi:anti-anti-sigma factor